LFIFFHVKENEPKENAVPRLILRVVDAAGARGNSPAGGGLKQVRVLFSDHLADARRGTKGYKKLEPERHLKLACGELSQASPIWKVPNRPSPPKPLHPENFLKFLDSVKDPHASVNVSSF
jgi:hypothetical protein